MTDVRVTIKLDSAMRDAVQRIEANEAKLGALGQKTPLVAWTTLKIARSLLAAGLTEEQVFDHCRHFRPAFFSSGYIRGKIAAAKEGLG